MTRLALCYLDAAGRRWFLHREAGLGNLMRTPDPLSARLWDHLCEVEAWAARLPQGAKEQLKGHVLQVVPVSAAAGDPVHVLGFEGAPADADKPGLVPYTAPAAPALALSPDPAPPGRRRRA